MSQASGSSYRQKVAQLEQSIAQTSQTVKSKERCIPYMIIAGAIFPVLLGLILYFAQPAIVQTKEGGKMVRSTKKLFYWTIGITLLVWCLMYGYSWWSGHSVTMVCTK